MSFTRIHTVEKTFGDEKLWLGVYADRSACLYINNATDGQIIGARAIDAKEDGSDIAICGDVKTWFDKELAAGRAKAGES